MLTMAKARAKLLGLPFNLTLEDISIPPRCPVLDIPIVITQGTGKRQYGTPSLDRVIPAHGYVKGNVIVVSWRANDLKGDMTLEEICKMAKYVKVYSRFIKKGKH